MMAPGRLGVTMLDNAAVMTGHVSDLQQRISVRNHRAQFVNSDTHNLNVAEYIQLTGCSCQHICLNSLKYIFIFSRPTNR